ncbi:hypothetical protein Cgig2_023124 [Carnegiea gigantea]|uniref:Ubiquitin-like protease family profile domain-containing protein n=1 Tax=Carnegiea gigantea TaxID=171969 RepID=A0A9Q1Q618_9CARY|nr:hypothetical protein Cgig2_023124 [Carnegiea gigantea]
MVYHNEQKQLPRQMCIGVDFSSPHMSTSSMRKCSLKPKEPTDLNTIDIVFFPILRSEHFFFVVFQFADKTVNIIGNLMLPEKPSTRYGSCDTLLKLAKSLLPNAFPKYLIERSHQKAEEDNIDLYDCGIHTMHHLETYYDDLQSWDHEALLRILRVNYGEFRH